MIISKGGARFMRALEMDEMLIDFVKQQGVMLREAYDMSSSLEYYNGARDMAGNTSLDFILSFVLNMGQSDDQQLYLQEAAAGLTCKYALRDELIYAD